MIGMIVTIAGIFAGIALMLAAMYSVTQILLLEGWPRAAHFIQLVLLLTVMWSLYWHRDVPTAQIIAVPLLGVALWTFVLEVRWYRVFPFLIGGMAALLISGNAALTPI